MHNQVDKVKCLYPRSSYYDGLKTEYLAYNSNLQELSQKVANVCVLENGREISAEQAYEEVKRLWTQFKQNKNQQGIGANLSTQG